MGASPLSVFDRTAPRRIIFGLLLVASVTGLVVVSQNDRSSTIDTSDSEEAIDALIPTPGSEVLRQSEVGIDVAEGYRAALTVNGVTIPEDQITGIPGGDRQPALGRYVFSPGPDKVIETWDAETNCVIATVWEASGGPDAGITRRWCFSAA